MTSYAIRIGTVLSPALLASFPVRGTSVAVPRGAVYRLRVSGQPDIADVVLRLHAAGVTVLEVRREERAAQPAGWSSSHICR